MDDAAREWPAALDSLPAIGAWVLARAATAGAEADAAQDLRLAIEEIVTNAITHGGATRLALRVEGGGGAVTAVIRDDARPFDPRQAPAPDPAAPLEARRVGGLGWYLVRRLMHDVRHRPLSGGRGNEVTLVRRLDGDRPDSGQPQDQR